MLLYEFLSAVSRVEATGVVLWIIGSFLVIAGMSVISVKCFGVESNGESSKEVSIFRSFIIMALEKFLLLPAIFATGWVTLPLVINPIIIILWSRNPRKIQLNTKDKVLVLIDVLILILDYMIGVYYGIGSAILAHSLLIAIEPLLVRTLLKNVDP